MIFSEHFGEKYVILVLQTVAKWWCIKFCAIFSGPLCIYYLAHNNQKHVIINITTTTTTTTTTTATTIKIIVVIITVCLC